MMSNILWGSLMSFSCEILQFNKENVLWKGFSDSYPKDEAKGVSIDTNNTEKLKKAGLYFFHELKSFQSNKLNRYENASKALEYFEAAYKLDRNNPVITTWTATANLALAGLSGNLFQRYRLRKRGIKLFNSIKEDNFGNLNYLSMRTMAFTLISRTCRRLTKDVLESGLRYIEVLESERDNLDEKDKNKAFSLELSIYVSIAFVENLRGKSNDVGRKLLSFNEQVMFGSIIV